MNLRKSAVKLPRLVFNRSERDKIMSRPANEHVRFTYARFSEAIPAIFFVRGVREELEIVTYNLSGAFESTYFVQECSEAHLQHYPFTPQRDLYPVPVPKVPDPR